MAVLSVRSAQSQPPPQLTANFTDLSKIEKISKLRSCTGHLTIPQDNKEPRSSMKHYFHVKPEFLTSNTVPIFSPYDGYVSIIRSEPEHGLQGEIWISPSQIFAGVPPIGVWNFSVQHIDISKNLKVGDKVKAGGLLGYAAFGGVEDSTQFDIVYGKVGIPPKTIDGWTNPFADLDSVFNHMTDEAFAPYKEVGIASKDEFIISKEEREKVVCEYREQPYFSKESQDLPNNWIFIR